jgi:cytochrome c oxidase subunit 2
MVSSRIWLSVFALVLAAGPPVTAIAADAARGRELFDLCTQCHGDRGQGNQMALAPAIAGLSEWYLAGQLAKFKSGARGAHPGDIGGLRMMPMSLWLSGEQDVADVAAYVASLPPADPAPELTGGDPARGRNLYLPCAACHGAQAEGLKALEGPGLRHSSDWYLLTELQNFKAGVRGTSPGDAAGGRMRPMTMVLVDEQAMKDVIAYIMTLRDGQ